jgi:hypothetical protein
MTTEIVISPILDEIIQEHLASSKIWEICYHPDEVNDEITKKYPILYRYDIKFDGLIPTQWTKTSEYVS